METKEIDKIPVAQAVQKLLAEMPEQRWQTPYLFPKFSNFKTKRPYRGGNALLIQFLGMEHPEWSPWFLTFRQVKELGGWINQGEKSISVEYWKPFRIVLKNGEKEIEDVDYDEVDRNSKWARFHYRIFNCSQTHGFPLPKFGRVPPANEQEMYDKLLGIARRIGVERVQEQQNMAWYSPARDVINIPPLEYLDKGEGLCTLLHEIIHSTAGRVGRDKLKQSEEECVAEMGAMMGCMMLHIPYKPANSVAYLRGWGKEFKPEQFEKCISLANKALAFLEIDKEQKYKTTKVEKQEIERSATKEADPTLF